MAILACNEIWSERSRSDDQNLYQNYTKVYRVITDSPTYSQGQLIDDATTDACVPSLLATYSDTDGYSPIDLSGLVGGAAGGATTALCYRREARQDQDDPYTWKVTVHFSSDPNIVPVLAPEIHNWGQEKYQRVIYTDTTGAAIVNTAGEMFDPPVTVDDSRIILTVTRPEVLTDCEVSDLQYKYTNAINTDQFFGWPELTVRCDSITAEQAFAGDLIYFRMTYVFHFKVETWQIQLLNMGYKYKYVKDGKSYLRVIMDPTGHPTQTPWPLGATGLPYDPNTDGPVSSFIESNILTFQGHEAVDFSALNIRDASSDCL